MLFAAVVTKSLKAQEMATLPQTFEQNGVIKQIEHEDLLISIENWLSSQFNLPTINHHPRRELVAPSTIASLGYKKLLSDPSVVAESETTESQPNTVSLYDDVTQTIYLPKGWTGSADVCPFSFMKWFITFKICLVSNMRARKSARSLPI